MRRVLRLFWLAVLSLATAIVLWGSENYIRFDHISAREGLSQNVIHCILQSKKGFMWFGTQSGLNRYDGYNFTAFQHKPGDSTSLPVNKVKAIYEDRHGNLWIGTEGGGLNLFNPDREDFTRFRYSCPDDQKPGTGIDLVQDIYEDNDGILWLGTWGGLLRFDPSKGEWRRYYHHLNASSNLSSNKMRDICPDSKGRLWIATEGGGVNVFRPDSKTFKVFRHQPGNPGSLSSDNTYAVFTDSKGNHWVGTEKGLDRYDAATGGFVHYRYDPAKSDSISHNHIQKIFEDQTGIIWVGTRGGGLNRLKSISEKTFYRYLAQSNNPYSLSYNIVLSIAEDHTGSLWVGTEGGGVNRIDLQKRQFGHVLAYPDNPNSLSSSEVTSIFQDHDDKLWIGTYDKGLNRYDRTTGIYEHLVHDSGNPSSLSSNEVTAIFKNKAGDLWVGTWGGGISRYNYEKKDFTRFRYNPSNPGSLASNKIFGFSEDKDGHLWIGTWGGGLNMYREKTQQFVNYRNNPANPTSIRGDGVTCIYPDLSDNSILWIGTYNNGLERFNRHTKEFSHFAHNPGDPRSLSHNSVRCLFISPSHPEIVWIGTAGGGLNRLDKIEMTWKAFTEVDGLANNTVYGILEDDAGNLWMSTNKGISRFNPVTNKFTNYDQENGLQGNEFNQGAFHKSSDGRFYFGGINGYNEFYPEKISPNPYPPPVVITSFKVMNKPFAHLSKSILETPAIQLHYKEYIFSFEFAALNYSATAKNRYAYKMEGFDEGWIQLGRKREATFTRLEPGKYTFKVIASNNDGIWNNDGASIDVVILPPFWLTWWFKVILIVLILGTVLLMYSMRVRRYKIQRRELEEKVALRTWEIREQKEIIEVKNNQLENSNRELQELNATKDKFFSIISHDLRNHLTTLMGNSGMLAGMFDSIPEEKKRKYSRSIDKAANQLHTLLENLLQWARSQTRGLLCKPRKIDLNVIIPETVAFHKLNAKKKKIELSASINGKAFVYADKDMVNAVLRNLVSNAIKFTEKGGDVRLTVQEKEECIVTSVTDTGVGIDSEQSENLFKVGMTQTTKGTANEKGTGLGLILCKEFVEANNGTIWHEQPEPDTNGDGFKGSIFRFSLPKPLN